MRFGLAFFAGVLGGAVMSALLIVARIADMTEMNMAMMLGSTITGNASTGAWALGFAMHLVISGLIALIYAAAFEAIRRSTWWLGLIGGVIHATIGGLVLLLMPTINPAIPDLIAAPGAFALNYGAMSTVGFILLHLIYGMIVGGLYEPIHIRPGAAGRREPIPEERAVGVGHDRRWPE